MVESFGVLGSEEELDSLDFDFRTFQLIVSSSNISRELNNPTYTIDFAIIVMDKVDPEDDRAVVLSSEENVFVIAQFQDYLQQQDEDSEFGNIDLINNENEDYAITAAYTEFSVTFSRKQYTVNTDLG